MSKLGYGRQKKGFSLMELLIVIFIISLVYYLGFSGVELGKQRPKALTPMNLKETIVSSKLFSKDATLVCVNKCTKCYMRQGIASFQPYESKIDLKNIKAYTIDDTDSLQRIEYGRYKDQKICLMIDFYANGSSTPIILKDDKESYFLPSFFGEAKKFESVEEAKDYWLEKSHLVSNEGEFY